jgi:hypothetical protein
MIGVSNAKEEEEIMNGEGTFFKKWLAILGTAIH